MLQLFKDLISGDAYRPAVTSQISPISGPNSRFLGRRAIGLSFSSTIMRSIPIEFDRAGVPLFGELRLQELPKDEKERTEIKSYVVEAADRAKADAALVLCETGWSTEILPISVPESDLDRNKKLRENPKDLLGYSIKPDSERYSVVGHPAYATAVTFTIPSSTLTEIAGYIETAGYTVAHMQITPSVILDYLRTRRFEKILNGADLLILTSSSSFLLTENKKQWDLVRYYTDIDPSSVQKYTTDNMLNAREDPLKPIQLINLTTTAYAPDGNFEHIKITDPLEGAPGYKPAIADFYCLTMP